MRLFTRGRLAVLALVAAFAAAFFAIGAVSRSSPTIAAGTTLSTGSGNAVPFASWYWTMAVSPSDPQILLLATSSGLYRSADGGKKWQPVGPKGVNATSVVQVGDALLMGGVKTPRPGSPVIRKGADRTAPDGAAMLASSKDDGKTWAVLKPRGLPDKTVQAMVVDPAKTDTVYVLLNSGALYRSTDGGRSFAMSSAKLGTPPWSFAITKEQFVAGNMDTGYSTSANGKKWQKSAYKDSRGDTHVMEFAVWPDDAARVLMTSRGVELSKDGGKTWKVALKSDEMFGPVAWAPGKTSVAYAIGFDRSLWRSDDQGETWARVA
jgi:photosystem II stability/assembly factor-like uncharacterized protein